MNRWWIRLARYALPQWRGVSGAIVLTILGVVLEVLKPWPLKLILDSILAGKPLPSAAEILTVLPGASNAATLLGWLALAAVVLFLASCTRETVQKYIETGVGSRMAYALAADLFQHAQRLSLRFHGRSSTGDLVGRITSNTGCVRDLVFGVFIPTFGSLFSLVVMVAIMWRLDRMLCIIALVAAPLLGMLVRLCNRAMEARAYRQMELEGELAGLTEQTLSALPIIRAFGREESQDRRFAALCVKTGKAYVHTVMAQIQFKTGAGAVTATATAIVIAAGGFQVLNGSLSLGSLWVFLSYLSSLYAPMETLAYLSSGFASAHAGARRIFETMDQDDHVKEHPQARALIVAERGAAVAFENVTFGYEAGRAVLSDVNFEVARGETVALVGPTGAGKSTLVSLLPRFFDPWQGRITIEGVDAREIRIADLRDKIAFVLQEPFLFPMSIADNIAYGRPGASRESIIAAAAGANAEEFIRRLPEGFDTVIGERGTTLSTGQRQRLSIARALLKDAPIVILDEPTAALDAQTESLLLSALERLLEERTSFVIAHRLSTVRKAHRIMVLDQGRVVEAGRHEELLQAGGVYARFTALQGGTDATILRESQGGTSVLSAAQ